MPNFLVERLRKLPIHKTDEVWEVAASAIPSMVARGPDGRELQMMVCVCVSSAGGTMMSELAPKDDFSEYAGLDALARFALDPHMDGARPLDYLPSRVHIGPMPEHTRETVSDALKSLGIHIEHKPSLEMSHDFFLGLEEHLMTVLDESDELDDQPIPAPGLMKSKGMTIERVRSFAEGSMEFWRSEPWRQLDREELWEVAPAPAAKHLRYVIVMGGGGEAYGLGFFASIDQYLSIAEASLSPMNVMSLLKDTLWTVGYESIKGMPVADAKLWRELGLVEDDEETCYAVPVGVSARSRSAKRPTPVELTEMEGILRLFAKLSRRDVKAGSITADVVTALGPKKITLKLVQDF